MPRYKLTIEYDGTNLAGWQAQEGLPTAQGLLEEAIYQFCGERVLAYSAGRTDAGVHARGQVAHIDLSVHHRPFTVRQAINFHLIGQPLIVVEAEEVSPEFHARFSAIRRHYRYTILNRRARGVLDASQHWHVAMELDVAAMQAGADRLVGHHDFSSFRDRDCQSKSPEKTLEVLKVTREGEHVLLYTCARSFLHHQVRIMTGTLVEVGRGRATPDDVTRALDARQRSAAGPTAPAGGLCFLNVDYPDGA
jgi:tRNA pseudouridine38-40 synthase